MRIYIIGNDEITLCGEPPATDNEGKIAVASNEELHAARLREGLNKGVGAGMRGMAVFSLATVQGN